MKQNTDVITKNMLPKDAARYVINSVLLKLKDIEEIESENIHLKLENITLDSDILLYIKHTGFFIHHCYISHCDELCFEGKETRSDNYHTFLFCDACGIPYCENHADLIINSDNGAFCLTCSKKYANETI